MLFEHDVPGGDVATNFDNSLGDLSQASYIPNPGNGTNQSGDTPQEVLFIVTDGVEDEQSGSSRLQQAINDLGNAPGGNSSGTNWCTTIKNRGIQIAVLYTDYLPVPANSWYESWIAPIQSDIGPALQACASPGLFYDAAIGVGPRAGAVGAVRRGDQVGPPDPVTAEEPNRSKPGSNSNQSRAKSFKAPAKAIKGKTL